VFITNVVKCRPPDNRDPEPDEIAACAGYLQRQLAVLDPAVVVTLGRFSMASFMPGVRISQAHGTTRIADPETGARDATVFAMYHPAYALRNPAVERESFDDVARIPDVLITARARRAGRGDDHAGPDRALATSAEAPAPATAAPAPAEPPVVMPPPLAADDDQLTIF
jgi:DNA polymerase